MPIPKEAIMHDWWIALVTAAFGKIKRISKTTVLYRQHDKNKIGAKQWGINYLVKALATELTTKGLRKSISRCESVVAFIILERIRSGESSRLIECQAPSSLEKSLREGGAG